jgi:hypothetical protein
MNNSRNNIYLSSLPSSCFSSFSFRTNDDATAGTDATYHGKRALDAPTTTTGAARLEVDVGFVVFVALLLLVTATVVVAAAVGAAAVAADIVVVVVGSINSQYVNETRTMVGTRAS